MQKDILKENFVAKPGASVSQECVMKLLNVDTSAKRHVTNLVKMVFPEVTAQRRSSSGVTTYHYNGLAQNIVLTSPISTHISSPVQKELSACELPQIRKLKDKIREKETEMAVIDRKLENELVSEHPDKEQLHVFFKKQHTLVSERNVLQDALERIYEEELNRLTELRDSRQLRTMESEELNNEINFFTSILDFGFHSIDEDIKYDAIHQKLQKLPDDMRDKCPLIYNIVETLLLTKDDQSVQSQQRVRSATHALAILVSLRNQKIQNNFKLMFTMLCVSHGAGERFVTLLNHIGLNISWKKIIQFLDSRLKQKSLLLKKKTEDMLPIILLMDNINMYRGKKKHIRLLQHARPTMWNFTGRGLFTPNLSDVKSMLSDKEKCLKSQKDVLLLECEEMFLENDQDKVKLWESARDKYLLDVLDKALNHIPSREASALHKMTEKEVNNWLRTAELEKSTKSFKINVQQKVVSDILGSVESDVVQLPLSLEDNSTIAGTLNILTDFADLFALPTSKIAKEFCPMDTISMKFDVKLARAHFELRSTLIHHQNYMADLKTKLHSREKTIGEQVDDLDTPESENDQASLDKRPTTLENERRRYQLQDQPFWEMYNTIYSDVFRVIESGNEDEYVKLISDSKTNKINKHKDHLQRSLLHVAVEMENINYVKFLVRAGCLINAKEGCGLTPLNLAVIKKNKDIVQFLVTSGAKHSGPLFSSIPSPCEMAQVLDLPDIQAVFDRDNELSDDEDSLLHIFDPMYNSMQLPISTHDQKEKDVCNRQSDGFLTPVVGDVGTCKTNCAAMSRSSSYSWVGIIPGDLHNKGYYCEAVVKAHGASGLHYLLTNVLNRKRLTNEAFKDHEFNDDNLTKIPEGIRDTCMSYSVAAALEFRKNVHFPSQRDLIATLQANKCHNLVLLKQFKEWLEKCSNEDLAFKHHSSLLTLYGPLLQLYDDATAYGDGYAREMIYQLQTPLYAQLSFPNYFTECFRHVVNLLAKWPELTQSIVQENCSINISGKVGHGIEMDAYVETEIVKPLKSYASGHSTVIMCERIMGSLDLFRKVRKVYKSRDCFDIHHTTRHSVQSPLPDQIKGAWFCLQKDFFKNKGRKEVKCYPLSGKGAPSGKLQSNFIEAYSKGQEKIKKCFVQKLYECFPDIRYRVLSK